MTITHEQRVIFDAYLKGASDEDVGMLVGRLAGELASREMPFGESLYAIVEHFDVLKILGKTEYGFRVMDQAEERISAYIQALTQGENKE